MSMCAFRFEIAPNGSSLVLLQRKRCLNRSREVHLALQQVCLMRKLNVDQPLQLPSEHTESPSAAATPPVEVFVPLSAFRWL